MLPRVVLLTQASLEGLIFECIAMVLDGLLLEKQFSIISPKKMPEEYFLKSSREKIQLAPKPFAGGGEGDLYQIIAPSNYKKYVAKVYHPHKRSKQREDKTQYLMDHPPIGLFENGSIVWVLDALYDSTFQFVGFIMPFAKGKKLEILCLGKLPKRIGKEWHRFDLHASNAMKYRLRICFNLAAAIYQIHATDHYVLVDMKPENIIIQPNGLLAIVDTDSVEVIEDGIAIYPAPVATPEYTPPEFYTNQSRKTETVGEPWDRFGLAVIFYKLLCGIHPFTGSAKPPYDNLVSLHEKIEHGLFVHSTSKKDFLSVVPSPHQRFEKLVPNLQDLFIQCFEEGHDNPEARPSANEWCAVFLKAIGDPKLEAHFAHIMGIWGDRLSTKMELPSMLYRKKQVLINPKQWIKEEVNNFFENIPPLPIGLHQAIQSGKQTITLRLEWKDYLFSWLFFLSLGVFLLILNSRLRGWLLNDFWLSDTLYINFVFVVCLMTTQILFPRISSFVRHLVSPAMKTQRLWRQFRLYYPQLKDDALKVKEKLLQQLMHQQEKELKTFNEQKEIYIPPLKDYLQKQDEFVRDLMKARKVGLDAINTKYLEKAIANPLLREMKGQNVIALQKRLKHYYQRALEIVNQYATEDEKYQRLKEEYENAIRTLKDQETTDQKAFMEEAMCIFQMNYFCDKYLVGTPLENAAVRGEFSEHVVNSLCDIESMTWDNRQNLIINLYSNLKGEQSEGPIRIVRTVYPHLKALKAAFEQYQEGTFYARNHDINYGKKYFQERYAVQKKAYEKKRNRLTEKYESHKKLLLKTLILERTQFLKKHYKTAQLLLAELKATEEQEVLNAEAGYDEQYQQVYTVSQAKVEETIKILEGVNEKYKLEVQSLLATPEIEKTRIILNGKIIQAQEDIVKLEHLRFRFD